MQKLTIKECAERIALYTQKKRCAMDLKLKEQININNGLINYYEYEMAQLLKNQENKRTTIKDIRARVCKKINDILEDNN